jgi:hypothetical protein
MEIVELGFTAYSVVSLGFWIGVAVIARPWE